MTTLADRLRTTTNSAEQQKRLDQNDARLREEQHQLRRIQHAIEDSHVKQADLQELLAKAASEGKRTVSYRLSYWNRSSTPDAYSRTSLDLLTAFAKSEGLNVEETVQAVDGCGGIDPAGPTETTYDYGLTISW